MSYRVHDEEKVGLKVKERIMSDIYRCELRLTAKVKVVPPLQQLRCERVGHLPAQARPARSGNVPDWTLDIFGYSKPSGSVLAVAERLSPT